jgi:hypothetical protein
MSHKNLHEAESEMSTTIKESSLAISTRWVRSNAEKAAKYFKKIYTVPTVEAALAGPVASFLPLESLAPIAALLATNFSNCHLRQNIVDGLGSNMHSSALRGFQKHLLSLLSFLNLSAIFGRLPCKISPSNLAHKSDTLGALLRTYIPKLSISICRIKAILADLTFSMIIGLTGSSGVFPRSQCELEHIWQRLANLLHVSFSRLRTDYHTPFEDSISHLLLHNLSHMVKTLVAKGDTEKPFSKNVDEQQLEEWVVLEFEELYQENFVDESNERAAALMCEIVHLISSCEGQGCVDWDELIAMLEGEQKAGQKPRTANFERSHRSDNAEPPTAGIFDPFEDWELVA